MPGINMAKQSPKHLGWLFKLVGSLAYLYVTWQIWASPPLWLVGGLSASLATLGLGMIAATAVLSSVAYFFATFGSGFMENKKETDMNMRMSAWTWRMGTWSAFSLFVLTIPGPWSWVVLIGFVLSMIGSAMSMM